ncbi:hypothetical protein [Rufibacter quisquiliarum]|uniref:Uncharacterized protein (TIGR02588 family) n=1 Tax=Rufibacter quisquiliarum TaxID=1549639 RepID=A0A839GZ24_9BACT|nr:hypothetical protein [Rufibacter quisquiliarum]MBA9079688.1 uncharacterized protein (TIGR02588 family) [Rufibacter quisquiliarum]
MKKNALEWCVFGASVLLIVALIGYLGVKAITYQSTPPDLRVEIMPEKDILRRNIQRIELINHGEQTAENVAVEVVLLVQGKETETAEALFPLAPKESKQEAWVTFRTPPAEGQRFNVHILGYNKP